MTAFNLNSDFIKHAPLASPYLLILSVKVKNNFVSRGISTIATPDIFEKKPLNPMWVTGLTDSEGSFIISIYKRKQTNNWQINPSFQLWVDSKDLSTLEDLKDFFGVGLLNTRQNKAVTSFTVSRLSDLINVIIPHFTNFPLQTQKRVDFNLWAKIVKIMSNKEHLTPEGVLKIFSLKSALNKGLSKNINDIENIKILERPLHLVDFEDFKQIDPHWISGFTAGDGSFDIQITQRGYKYQIELRFRITQHIRDAHLLGIIAEYLGCGKVYIRSNDSGCDLVIRNFPDNINKVIPFFNQYPIRTVKEKDFKDFALAAEVIKTKAHLTPEGLAKIKELKSNMNNSRMKDE